MPLTHATSLKPIEVMVHTQDASLPAFLLVPENAVGLVLFAHGSGSSRFSARNHAVAATLNSAGLATLLMDLLTHEEHEIDQSTRALRFDIELLTARLVGAIDWAHAREETAPLPLGLFGASTGAAAALRAAAARPGVVAAVVSRGGRPDLAMEALPQVQAATLLIVGGEDKAVIEMNQAAAKHIRTTHELRIIPGATHLFEELGCLEQVAKLACDWFLRYLPLK